MRAYRDEWDTDINIGEQINRETNSLWWQYGGEKECWVWLIEVVVLAGNTVSP